jgi:hypothetical protein
MVIYRAPAEACNACRSKAACTDSNNGREIERQDGKGIEYGMQRFHRAMSLTLLVLASLMLVVELFRAGGLYPRVVLLAVLAVFCLAVQRLCTNLSEHSQKSQLSSLPDPQGRWRPGPNVVSGEPYPARRGWQDRTPWLKE